MGAIDILHTFQGIKPTIDNGLRCFERLWPWYVKWIHEYNSCCCEHHVPVLELKYAFNSMKQRPIHRATYICGCRVCKLECIVFVLLLCLLL
jgi:hypothetical protein